MIEGLIFISNSLTGGLRVSLCLFLVYRLISTEKPNKKEIFIALAGATSVTLCVSLFQFSNFYQMAVEAVLITICTSVFQRADIRKGLFISVFYEIAVTFWLFLISSGLGILFHLEKFLDNTNLYGQMAVWMLHLLLLLLMLYISKHQDMERKDAFWLASVIALSGFLAAITLSEQTILQIPNDTLTMWMILSIVLLMSVLVFNISHQYEVEKELAKLKSEQAELLERDYTTLNNAYTANAKLFHDFHNHIGALRQFLSHQKYEKALAYLDELQEPIQEITDTVWTGDETVDYLINSKTVEAISSQIKMQVQVEFPQHTNIRSADLCTILGNLLDNALDAVRQNVEPEQKKIVLTIRRINQMLVIKVGNPFWGNLIIKNESLQTTKTEFGLHGWGLKSAQTAAKKYDGMVRTTCEGNVFRAVVTLSYHSIPIESYKIY